MFRAVTRHKWAVLLGGVAGRGPVWAVNTQRRPIWDDYGDSGTTGPEAVAAAAAAAAAAPDRAKVLQRLQDTKFDVLVVGGGATGTGVALDASLRGLKVALVEKADFAAGTSSKSTKLAHGGVRYLEKAVFELSKPQLDLVVEALNERAHLLYAAPHLTKILPIIIPVYEYWKVPYFYAGCKMYDFFAGAQNLKSSYLLSRENLSHIAPMLDQKKLKMGLVYHDGIFNDSRLCATLAISAVERGATVANYVSVEQLIKDKTTGVITGAKVEDQETGGTFTVNAKIVVNATGPYSDKILQMDANPQGLPEKEPEKATPENALIAVRNPKMVVPSRGVHITLPSFYCPSEMGLLDASTSDGRVMFFLPWQGKVIAGTTDIPLKQVPRDPSPTEADIQDILQELQHYIQFPVRREDVLSAWAGIRPLVRDPRVAEGSAGSGQTEGLVRSHFIFTSPTQLVTIAGGKWTTYREMAEETVDEVIKVGKFQGLKPCTTRKTKLIGAQHWNLNFQAYLQQRYAPLEDSLAEHLANNYGDRAPIICEMFEADKSSKLPVGLYGDGDDKVKNMDANAFDYPFTIAELKYCIRFEYVRTALDFLLRRSRFAFLDAREALNAVDPTVNLIGDELGWDAEKRAAESAKTKAYIKTFGV
ncbi:glycerol-3-phosphate dehydrogenase KNAG_0L02190 [Huiozyma naganishii CBS 8797]|uniref:Glycerol-3-phosphate dehydrogenase n=1 Tax=Huiozyma naganishii (strain ATCC MYA-139 / BCRC 22969 / CBS 8797 / KCTC 17520 / NBRC 10181 / NCYC 3082 / Yp74L-3) TaxID=1071383 RepID=J7SB84_HUIN7|nr:hypothetical protein KNAG_0L02190 [Kazachstania naganishii CBS 8797]CCK72836.1 hypothetical protein KNAG_0L02190 [Kazachstania naganishii CBS 8797]